MPPLETSWGRINKAVAFGDCLALLVLAAHRGTRFALRAAL